MIVYYIGYIFTFLVLLRFSIYTIRGTMGSPSKSVEMARKLSQGKLSGPSWCLNNILFRKSEKIAFRESLARLASVRSNPCYSGPNQIVGSTSSLFSVRILNTMAMSA